MIAVAVSCAYRSNGASDGAFVYTAIPAELLGSASAGRDINGLSFVVRAARARLHPAGIEEPRLVGFARELAKSGLTVMTPGIAELSRFEIIPLLTDHIERVALWLSMNPDF